VDLSAARFRLAATGVICLATLTLAVMGWGGFYYQDDFLFLRLAHDSPFTVSYLAEGAFGHFFPGLRAAFWVQDRTVGLNHDVAVIVVALLHLASLVAMCRLLVLLFGRRPGTLILLTMFSFSGLWLSAYLWWVSALQVMPAMALTIVAIDGYVRYLVGRRGRHLAITAAALAVSLLFYEKPAQLLVLLPLLTVLAFASADSPRAWLRDLAGLWRMWAVFAVVLVLYAAAYLSGDFFVATDRPDPATLASTIAFAWHQSFVPALLGGPLTFHWNGSLGLADPSRVLTIVDQLVVLALVVVSVRRRRAAWRGWAFVLAAFAINVAVIAWTRSGQFGADVGRELKYVVDILPYAILGLGLAFMAPRIGPRAEHRQTPQAPSGWPMRVVPTVAMAAFLTVFAISGVRFAENWHDGVSARFARGFKAAVAHEPPSDQRTVFFDGEVPALVLSPIFRPFQRHSVLLELFGTHLRYAGQATRTVAVGPDGRITPHEVIPEIGLRIDALTVDTTPIGTPGSRRVCLPDDRAPHFVSVPLTAPLPRGRRYLRLIAVAPHGATVRFDQQAGIEVGITVPARRVMPLRLDGSRRPLYVPLEAPGAVTVGMLFAAGGPVCLERGYVGMNAPTPDR